jgi:hypothetical protein
MLTDVNDEDAPAADANELAAVIELTCEERVANGWRWLSETFPGWQDRIDWDTLDLANSQSCICGQVFGDAAEANPGACGGGSDPSGYDLCDHTLFSEANGWISGLVSQDPARPLIITKRGKLSGWTAAHDRRSEAVAVALGFLAPDHNPADRRPYDDLQAEWQRRLDVYDVGRPARTQGEGHRSCTPGRDPKRDR